MVAAVDQRRVSDEADTGYALMLAAELSERAGDLPSAAALAGRAAEVSRLWGDPDIYPRGFRAEVLMRLGRTEEAMAELTSMRPLLTEDPDAASQVSCALEAGGHAEIAEQWLTDALRTALRHQREVGPSNERAAAVVVALTQRRHELRRDRGLPHDEVAPTPDDGA